MESKIKSKLSNDELIKLYIESLTKLEQKALIIAQQQLESSFNIEKSIGFIKFKEKLMESVDHK
tara:strand:+ start:118 stop:309 length:192 start_codon:yes stop_codon:yes gene_type:complete